ncbi:MULTISPECIES: hypothetical protein [unclassified Diaminobutyricimonas]|uniref:hypothetical protein n=1 Tax=unclassified Diaminobutyricimonas TaxID=2643261 RepID=UPI0012F509B9|nr:MULTISPECIES: hypothetical protein [unclassified Diaminobutyricimonas]
MPTSRARSIGALALAIGTVFIGAGCATPGTAPEPRQTETFEPLAVTVPMPDLGPRPTPDPLSDEQANARRLELQDESWKLVTDQYPSAVRPEDPFVGYISADESLDLVTACLTEKGVPFGYGTDAYGNRAGYEVNLDTEANAVGVFVCREMHRGRPRGPSTEAELGWLYDYLTQFLAPCYEANNYEIPPPPARDEFIARWPNQGWWPSPPGMPLEPAEEIALNEACPGPS